jgi:branched-subunit amino acid transport protein AzlD
LEPGAFALGSSMGGRVSNQVKKAFFAIVAVLSIAIVFLIFNAGNPNSILRYIIKNPSYDVLILIILSVALSIMSFYYAHTNETVGYEKIVQANLKNIRKLKKSGKSNEEIAKSILNAMNIQKGYRYNYAMKRLIVLLEKIG